LFFSEIAIGIPDENARKAILDVMSADLNIAPSFDMKQLARCQTVFFVYDDPDKKAAVLVHENHIKYGLVLLSWAQSYNFFTSAIYECSE
jgi:hypothetical protein